MDIVHATSSNEAREGAYRRGRGRRRVARRRPTISSMNSCKVVDRRGRMRLREDTGLGSAYAGVDGRATPRRFPFVSKNGEASLESVSRPENYLGRAAAERELELMQSLVAVISTHDDRRKRSDDASSLSTSRPWKTFKYPTPRRVITVMK